MAENIAGFGSPVAVAGNIVEREPLIPNSMFEVPPVSIFQTKVLAYVSIGGGYEAWFDYREHAGLIAEIREYTDKERNLCAKINKAIGEGTFTRQTSFSKLPDGASVIRKVRNPWLPIPAGCKLSDDEVTLVPA